MYNKDSLRDDEEKGLSLIMILSMMAIMIMMIILICIDDGVESDKYNRNDDGSWEK